MRFLAAITATVVMVSACSASAAVPPRVPGSAAPSPSGAATLVETATPVAEASTAPQASTAPPRASVDIANFAFSPAVVTIGIGGTINWTNRDGDRHSVVIAGGESPRLGSGSTYTRTFDAAGRFAYVCGIHSSMSGTVIVVGEAGSAAPSNEPAAGVGTEGSPPASDEDMDDDGGHHSGPGGGGDRSEDHSGHGHGGEDHSGPGGGGSGPG